MKQEIDKLLENQIYEIVPQNTVPKTKTVINYVYSYYRKNTPDGIADRHQSHFYANGSQQNYGHDFINKYFPVVL